MKKRLAPIALITLIIGCQSTVWPALQNIEKIVASDLAAGKTEAQIDSDACAALGGSALTDAVCVNVVQLVENIIASAIESGDLTGPALANAKAIVASHTQPAASSAPAASPPPAPASAAPAAPPPPAPSTSAAPAASSAPAATPPPAASSAPPAAAKPPKHK